MLVPYAAESRTSGELIEPFRAGLHELGYVEGQNIVLEYRFSGGQNERLPELAAELVRLPVDLIVAEKQEAILAAKEATTTIPIVMSSHPDPVWLGVVASLGRPAGNVTGLSNTAATLTTKRLELLQQVSPGISRVMVFYNHGRATAGQHQAQELAVPAKALGLYGFVIDVAVRQRGGRRERP